MPVWSLWLSKGPFINRVVGHSGRAVHVVCPVTGEVLLVEQGLIVAEEGFLHPVVEAAMENFATGVRVPIEPTIQLPLTREQGFWDFLRCKFHHTSILVHSAHPEKNSSVVQATDRWFERS